MNTYKSIKLNGYEPNYVLQFFKLLGLKPLLVDSNHDRYLTYYLILLDIKESNYLELIIRLKYYLFYTKDIDKSIKLLLKKDTSGFLKQYSETIKHFEDEDISIKFLK